MSAIDEPAPPVGQPEPGTMWVLGQYGAAMLTVQTFEAALASLVAVVEYDPNNTRHPLKGSALEKALGKLVRRNWHLLQKATPTEALRRLEGKIDPQLQADITALIEWRNFLAHRYLRVRLAPQLGGTVDFGPIVIELLELGKVFADVGLRVTEATKALLSAMPRTDANEAPDAVREAFAEAARSIFWAQPRPFRRARDDS